MSHNYSTNKFGVKILSEGTKSFKAFSEETLNLEFFLLYILLNESNNENIIEKKDFLKKLYENHGDEKLVDFLQSEKSDVIFKAKSYEKYFGQMAYTRMADNVLSYFKDILVEIIKSKPQILKSSEKESLDYIFSFSSMEELIEDITERNIEKLFYNSVKDIKKFFIERLGINLFVNNVVEKNFEQFIKQRNLIVHNRGIISRDFSKTFSNEYVKYEVGNTLGFSYENLSKINGTMTNLLVDLELAVTKKFNLEKFNL